MLQLDIVLRKYGDRMAQRFIGEIYKYRKATAKEIEKRARKILSEEKAKFIEKFESDPITIEIMERDEIYTNRMGIFPETSAEHRGNLYTYIGFESPGDTGIDEVIKRIKNCRVKSRSGDDTKSYYVYFPSEDLLRKLTPYPWTSKSTPAGCSWMYDLELRGINGFRRYLFDKDRWPIPSSRSGPAIEASRPIRKGGRTKTYKKKYFPTMYEEFKNKVLNRFKTEIFDKIGRNGEFLKAGKYIIK